MRPASPGLSAWPHRRASRWPPHKCRGRGLGGRAARRFEGRAGPLRRRVREHGAPTQRVGRDGRDQNDDELGHLGSCSARGAVVPGVRVELWQHRLWAGARGLGASLAWLRDRWYGSVAAIPKKRAIWAILHAGERRQSTATKS